MAACAESPQDWQLNRPILDCHKYMLDNQLHCDITFIFGANKDDEEEKIAAHKYMLICRSPVFEAMLMGPARMETDEIAIEDIEKDSFQEVLRFPFLQRSIDLRPMLFLVTGCCSKVVKLLKKTVIKTNLSKKVFFQVHVL